MTQTTMQWLTFEVALKFFRTLMSLQDTFYQALMTHNNTFGLIIDIVYDTMPRDNLLNSACLELFEFIRRENIKPFILHIVEKYREKIEKITYVDTFQILTMRYDQMQGYGAEADSTLFGQEEGNAMRRIPVNGERWQGAREMDATEEEYFNTSDDEDEVSTWVDSAKDATNNTRSSGPKTAKLLRLNPLTDPALRQNPWLITPTTTTMRKIPWTPTPKAHSQTQRPTQKPPHQPRHRRSNDLLKSAAARRRTKTSWSNLQQARRDEVQRAAILALAAYCGKEAFQAPRRTRIPLSAWQVQRPRGLLSISAQRSQNRILQSWKIARRKTAMKRTTKKDKHHQPGVFVCLSLWPKCQMQVMHG